MWGRFCGVFGVTFLMSALLNPEKYLTKRGGKWYYQRFIPKRFHHVDDRVRIRHSLNTESLDIAMVRRDAQVVADDNYWRALALEAADNNGVSDSTRAIEDKLYKAASSRAQVYGYVYKTVDRLAAEGDSGQILERLKILKAKTVNKELPDQTEIDALLGGVEKPKSPKVRISEAFELYIDKISYDDQHNKDTDQLNNWKKTKTTSKDYFIEIMGDLYIDEITRKDALKYMDFWRNRIRISNDGKAGIKPNTANRHIGNIRNLYSTYFSYIGEEDRLNPFRNLRFSGSTKSSVAHFEDNWVRNRILVPGLFDRLHIELKSIIYVLIETGARMSEICNLMPDDIHLDEQIPFISIRPREKRELKTTDSERDIPLMGVALEAMKRTPDGYNKYRGKGTLVSANLMKAFRNRELLPTKNHVIYSFRHSFEKRMLEANIDYGLRCTLMGHKNDRPAYGDGGSIEYRRDELLRIVHPFPTKLFV